MEDLKSFANFLQKTKEFVVSSNTLNIHYRRLQNGRKTALLYYLLKLIFKKLRDFRELHIFIYLFIMLLMNINYMCVRVCVHTHTRIHTHIRTHARTHTHTYTHIRRFLSLFFRSQNLLKFSKIQSLKRIN